MAGLASADSVRAIEPAMEWLEKAQVWEPNRMNINVIEAKIYVYAGALENGRLILDFLKINPNDAGAWHNMSIMFIYLEKYKEADCNKKALAISNSEHAQFIKEEIRKNRPSILSRFLRR